ncbi:restriction endonuclease subunit R, partial [Candidatus Woesearchaeota archaeon CG11_big_fil_rev_8_21_14_0_20_57_5]
QRMMLRAGLTRLNNLAEGFSPIDATRHPKMLVICEDTSVVPLVMEFLLQEGLGEEDLLEIHSSRKGDVTQDEWDKIKQQLFGIDRRQQPKIIVSVLMLREGFDVNNICVIVPLRSHSSSILLEQTIGRGLRLMWREPEYQDSKQESREKLLVRKQEPDNYMDILHIVEHPLFIDFYERELSGALGEVSSLPSKDRVVGDILRIPLKKGFEDYDFSWPLIIHDREEFLPTGELSLEGLEPFPVPLAELQPFIAKEGDTFYGEEMTRKTRFGEYTVTADIYTAMSYNTFIQKIVHAVSQVPSGIQRRSKDTFPVMQINTAHIAKLTDEYIRTRLFNQTFDPLAGNNWRILVLAREQIIGHILRNVSGRIYDMHHNLSVKDAHVLQHPLSGVSSIKVRESYALDVAKAIYEKLPYPSNKGGFEKAFMDYIDADVKVSSFIKLLQHQHDFVAILYMREDGLLAHYFPDFLVRIGDDVYIIET